MKKLVLFSSVLLFGLAPVAHAEFSFRSIKEKVSSTAHSLVKNAWSIAGSACLLASIGSGAAIAYQNTISSHPALETGKALVIPVALGIGSLLCFNFAKRVAEQNTLKQIKVDLELLQTNINDNKEDTKQYPFAEEIRHYDSMLKLLSTKIEHLKFKIELKNDCDISSIKEDLVIIKETLLALQAESKEYLSKLSSAISGEKGEQ